FERGEPVHVGHLHVHQHRVDRLGRDDVERELAAAGELGLVTGQLKRLRKGEQNVLLVVDDQNGGGHRFLTVSDRVWLFCRTLVEMGRNSKGFSVTHETNCNMRPSVGVSSRRGTMRKVALCIVTALCAIVLVSGLAGCPKPYPNCSSDD